MKPIFKITTTLASAVLLLYLSGCGNAPHKNSLILGTMSGPESELAQVVKSVAQKQYGLDVQIVHFTDYAMPNAALADGSIDANAFQHKPYLDYAMAKRGYQFAIAGKTFIFPMGIYSDKLKHLSDIKTGATVAIPNDPSNETRALLLLQKAGWIRLKMPPTHLVTPLDIAANPKALHIKTLNASQLPRVLPDVAAAAINTNYATLAGLLPTRDALFLEQKNSPYANIIVVRADDISDPKVKKLVRAFHAPAVIKKAEALFKGQAIPAG